MSVVGLLLAIAGGILGWSGWWSILFGAVMFFGAHRALSGEGNRINAVGLPIYIVGALLIMKAVGWITSLF